MAEIRLDYELTIMKAKQIKELSTKMNSIIDKLKHLESNIYTYWRGDASDQYIIECEKLIKYLVNTNVKINDFSDYIIKIANIIREAEEASLGNIDSLSTGS